ncbi:ABC transporter permease [Candidatus Latescibacterota bacterium]
MIKYCIQMFLQSIEDMRHQKLRTFLTMSGITWGTMAVILLLSLGESFRVQSLKNMSGLGSNIVIVSGGQTTQPFNGIPPGRSIRLRREYVEMIKKSIPEIEYISPEVYRYARYSYGENRFNTNCLGVIPEYGILRKVAPQAGGRFIDDLDIKNRRRVVFLGNEFKDKLFGEDVDAVGKQVMIEGIPFTVIGVMEKKTQNNSYMSQDAGLSFMPFSTYKDMYGLQYLSRIIYRAHDPVKTEYTKDRMYEVLGKKLGFDNKDKPAISIWDTSEMTIYFFYFFLGFEGFLLLGGIFTLLVGGIGVANIMYVAVRERRREIGIKSSLGATPRLILSQFLLESFIIMVIGGCVGMLLAFGIVALLASPMLEYVQAVMGVPVVNWKISVITAGILALIGFSAGWAPAKSAAEMDPVKALEF